MKTDTYMYFWVKAVKQIFFTYRISFLLCSVTAAATSRTKTSLFFRCSPFLYSPSCFSAQMEDKVQEQQPADNIFFRVHRKNFHCVDRIESDLVLCQ